MFQLISKVSLFFFLLGTESWEVPFEEISDLQWVGSGAQGAVFLGKFHGEEVAVKKVRDIKETEIKHLRKLKHPNIITFKCDTISDILQQSLARAALNVLTCAVLAGACAPRLPVTAS